MSTVSVEKTSSPSGAELAAKSTIEFIEAFDRWNRQQAHLAGASLSRLKLVNKLHCDGPQKMVDLAESLGVTARNVTVLVDGLEAEGLVERSPHPTDRRVTIIALAGAGDSLAQEFEAYTAKVVALFEALEPTDQRRLARIMKRLLEVAHTDDAS
jgi:DNA-binding MarR family transcriptional regulator